MIAERPRKLIWPRRRGERPTAACVALALVLAAAQTDESHRLEAAAADPALFRSYVIRARWLALEALCRRFPRCPEGSLAAVLGCPPAWAPCLTKARAASWWPDGGVDAVLRGIEPRAGGAC